MRELNRAMNEFRMMHQQPDSRREFDLYDPDYLKKDKPARVSDDDPRCGVSSLQKFEGIHFIYACCTIYKQSLNKFSNRLWIKLSLEVKKKNKHIPGTKIFEFFWLINMHK